MNRGTEKLQDIRHLGRIELLTPELERSLWYFRDVLGMEAVYREARSVYLRGYGDWAVTTLKLTAWERPGIGCVSWRTASPMALERCVIALEAAGLGLGWCEGDYGRGRVYRFRDPDGHVMDVYYDEEHYRAPDHLRSTLKNLPQRYTGRGVGVRRLDHVALLAREVGTNRRFAADVLGMQLREQVIFDEGRTEIGAWLSPNPLHHSLAYVKDVRGASGRLHHVAFWVDNREDVLRAADLLVENGIRIEAGPSKHNNSQGFYLYSFEPGGNRIEVYSGSYLVFAPDWEPVTWNESERGTGVYWGAALPDSFIQYGTPDLPAPATAVAKTPVFDPI